MKKKTIYWLTEEIHEKTLERQHLIRNDQFQLTLYHDLESLIKAFSEARTGIIVIGDGGITTRIEKWITTIASRPEFKGVKLILSVHNNKPAIIKLAYDHDFRDIIAVDLSPKEWLERFLFSVATDAIKITPPPYQIALNQPATINIPARIVWISGTSLRIESKLKAAVGEHFTMTGPLAFKLGAKKVDLQVISKLKTDLFYRFSEGFVCQYRLTETETTRKSTIISELAAKDQGISCKVFIIAKTPELRKQLIDQLPSPNFDILTAINIKSIVSEPSFFNPEIVFLEDELCTPSNLPNIRQMMENLALDTAYVVIGSKANIVVKQLEDQMNDKKIFALAILKDNLPEKIYREFLGKAKITLPDAPSDAVMITPYSENSLAELLIECRITKIHPYTAQLQLKTQLGNFGLCRIDMPFLKKEIPSPIFAKIISSYSAGTSLDQSLTSFFADVLLVTTHHEQSIISEQTIKMISSYFDELNPFSFKLAPQTISKQPILDAEEIKIEAPLQDEPTRQIKYIPKRSTPNVAKRQKKVWTNRAKVFGNFAIFFIFTTVGIFVFQSCIEKMGANYEKSGKNFSEKFESFHQKVRPPSTSE